MPRQIRNLGTTGWEHIILRGINRENLFYDGEDYARFFSTLSRFQRETAFEIATVCLMSNHVHLLMFAENGVHAQIIKRISVSYAAYYNKKYDRVGHVFQDRFRSEPVNDERYLLTVARYIYQNPQKAGVSSAREYPYTKVQTDGVLSGYFDSAEELFTFLDAENEERCLEYDFSEKHNDAEALKLLTAVSGSANPQEIQKLDRASRDRALHQLKASGLTVRQLARLTGINRNIIQRA